jgi:hypothetical protein
MNKLQNYVDAITAIAGPNFATASVAANKNAFKIPGTDVFVNFDDPEFQIAQKDLQAQLKIAEDVAKAAEVAQKARQHVQKRVQVYIDALAKIGVTVDAQDLIFILLDFCSVRDLGMVSPEMASVLDQLAPVPKK